MLRGSCWPNQVNKWGTPRASSPSWTSAGSGSGGLVLRAGPGHTTVLRQPDVFRAADRQRPRHRAAGLRHALARRHLGHPDEHPKAFDRCWPVLEAASLRRPLLLIHGLADDDVVRRAACACPRPCSRRDGR